MKKLLLLVTLTLGLLVGCGEKVLDEPNKVIEQEDPFDKHCQEIAKKYNIDIEGVVFSIAEEYIEANCLVLAGFKKGKIWIRKHNYDTKMEIFSADGKEKLDTIIKYTEPYVGEIIDTLEYVNSLSMEYDNNNGGIIHIGYKTKKNKTILNLLFCEDGVIVNSKNIDNGRGGEAFGIKYYKGSRYWLNNHWVLKYTVKEDVPNSDFDKRYVYFDFFSLSGNLLMSYKINCGDIFNLNGITPLNMTEFILNNKEESGFNFKRINIEKSNCIIWSTNINLNIPETAKYELTKSELFDISTVKAFYNITLYDGTKSTKTVNIDVNTGEYTVI